MNLMNQGLATQQAIVNANKNVIPFPTAERAAELRKQGKVIVHKPVELQHFVRDDDDFGPEAA